MYSWLLIFFCVCALEFEIEMLQDLSKGCIFFHLPGACGGQPRQHQCLHPEQVCPQHPQGELQLHDPPGPEPRPGPGQD